MRHLVRLLLVMFLALAAEGCASRDDLARADDQLTISLKCQDNQNLQLCGFLATNQNELRLLNANLDVADHGTLTALVAVCAVFAMLIVVLFMRGRRHVVVRLEESAGKLSSQYLYAKTESLGKKVADIESDIEGSKAAVATGQPEINDTLRAMYVEAGEWARHYSTVRMTLFTFFVTLSIGLVTFSSHQRDLAIPLQLAGIVLLVMVFLVYVFSRKYDRAEWQHRRDRWLLNNPSLEAEEFPESNRKKKEDKGKLKEPKWFSPLVHLPFYFALGVGLLVFVEQVRWYDATKPQTAAQEVRSRLSGTIDGETRSLPTTEPTTKR